MAISIHSPHARGDIFPLPYCTTLTYFNPLPSCEGRRLGLRQFYQSNNFNPLPSCEGRLLLLHPVTAPARFQSTPLMRGETMTSANTAAACYISIHSPHARGDMRHACKSIDLPAFQSTPLMRGETITLLMLGYFPVNFNPLPSCEGRLRRDIHFMRMCRFQSTPLMRGETLLRNYAEFVCLISIHSPHARGDES